MFDNVVYYKADYLIDGQPDNIITFQMQGEAITTFLSNRNGICINLPITENKNRRAPVFNEAGEKKNFVFPSNVNPDLGITNIRSLRWNNNNKLKINLDFEGEVFEMEDQRNWMDYSFKLYAPPLLRPYPALVKAGDILNQKVILKVSPENYQLHQIKTEGETKITIPQIGFSTTLSTRLFTKREISHLKSLNFKHYRVELYFNKNWKKKLDTEIINAGKINVMLELVLFLTPKFRTELDELFELLAPINNMIESILPLTIDHKTPPQKIFKYCYSFLKNGFPNIKIGYGTDAYFYELNAATLPATPFDFVACSMNPQVHSSDTKTIMENINTINDLIKTIKTFTKKPIHVSPLSFIKRKEHDGISNCHAELNQQDFRMDTCFEAGWFISAIFRLKDVDSISLHSAPKKGFLNPEACLYKVLGLLNKHEEVKLKEKKSITELYLNDGRRLRLVHFDI